MQRCCVQWCCVQRLTAWRRNRADRRARGARHCRQECRPHLCDRTRVACLVRCRLHSTSARCHSKKLPLQLRAPATCANSLGHTARHRRRKTAGRIPTAKFRLVQPAGSGLLSSPWCSNGKFFLLQRARETTARAECRARGPSMGRKSTPIRRKEPIEMRFRRHMGGCCRS